MKFISMSKFLLNRILSFPNKKTRLNLIKYNKKLMSKLNVSLYSIQKEYFNSIITESLLNTKDILNKFFDKETLNNLISDYENDRKGYSILLIRGTICAVTGVITGCAADWG